jgi:transposase
MNQLSAAAVERAMKLQDVMLRAMAKRITWFQAAEILGISCRQMPRWKTRFEHEGYEGLFDRRRGLPSPKRVPLETVEAVLRLYQERCFDFNVRHFHEKLISAHDIHLSYTWVKQALQGAGLGEDQAQTWQTSQTPAATTVTGHVVAHRCQSIPLVL